MMNAERYLIVNADDLGLSIGVNQGIIEAHKHGIVTSASLMVRGEAAAHAAAYSLEHPELSLGIHLDFCEWIYRTETWTWEPLYEVVQIDDLTAVADEVARQLAEFRRLVGREPTHIDSHQHVHRQEPQRSVILKAANEIGVPLRSCTPEIRYCGEFYGQSGKGDPFPEAITTDALLGVLATLPSGITELGCHPGFADELDNVYSVERALEVQVLCDPQIREALDAEGIILKSFAEVAGVQPVLAEQLEQFKQPVV